MRKEFISYWVVAWFVLAGSTLAMAQPEKILGTKASLVPPEGFQLADQFPGFIDKETGSSVSVMVIPGPLSEISAGFTKENMAPRKMELLSKEERKMGELDGVFVHLAQTAGLGTEYLKWIWVFGNDEETVLVTATFAKEEGEELSKKMRASVESVTWDESLQVDPFEGLTFRVEEAGKFQIAKAMGNMVILTEEGVFPIAEPNDPFVVVAASLTEDWQAPEDLQKFATRRLKQTQEFGNCEIDSLEDWQHPKMRGVLAKASGGGEDGERRLMQGLLVSEDGYYLLQAFCHGEEPEKFEEQFQKIFDSFTLVDS